jgi:hypothetical protein
MVDITEISAVVAGVGVLVGVVYYILDMRNQARLRQTDLVMRLYDKFSGTEFQDAWHKVRTSDVKKHSDIFDYPKELFSAMNQVCLFFEGVGILLMRGITDPGMVEDLFGGTIVRAWESVKAGVVTARQQLNDPEVYYYFEYLYNEMKKKEQQPASQTA